MKPYYQDSAVTIYHADCLAIDHSLLFGDLVLTDPPYNAENIGPNQRVYCNGQVMRLAPQDYEEFCFAWFSRISDQPTTVFTPGIANTHQYPQPKWQLCWHKPASVSFNRMGGFNAWEPVFVYGTTKHVRLGQDYLNYNTFNLKKGPESDHPCPKPLPFWSYLLDNFCPLGGIVIDPFMGSGTTLRAAKDHGRKAVGIEIEEAYCEIAARRMEQEVLDFSPETKPIFSVQPELVESVLPERKRA